jgi:hypothetical protein
MSGEEVEFHKAWAAAEGLVERLRELFDELDEHLERLSEEFDAVSTEPDEVILDGPLLKVMELLGDYMRGDRDWGEVEQVLRAIERDAGWQGELLPR